MGQPERKRQLLTALDAVRQRTLWLLDQTPDEFLRRRVHSFYSPIGWHFGHVGRTEEYWVISAALRQPVIDEKLSFLYADLADNPKDNRVNIPDRAGTIDYLNRTRQRVADALMACDLDTDDPYLRDGYAWEFAIQHECQHQETITEMLQLIQKQLTPARVEPHKWQSDHHATMVDIPGGTFGMGSNDYPGYDNEKCAHQVVVEPFKLAKHPVTAFEWAQFMSDGGYRRPELWSEEGWAWRSSESAIAPEYWVEQDGSWAFLAPLSARPIHPDEPAGCIGWYEAEAFANWSGRRLPTEAEWEYAASYDPAAGKTRIYPWGDCLATPDRASFGLNAWAPSPVGSHPEGASAFGIDDIAGGVWEWTSSKFLPYPGFRAFPYDGYSKDHMQGKHYVCRGGSWAASAPILRCSFRNWYVPTYRQGLLGVRLAEDVA